MISDHNDTFKHMKNFNDTIGIMSKFNVSKAVSEIKVVALVVDKNLSFLLEDDLIPFLQNLAPDSKILYGINLNRKRIIDIVNNVLAPTYREYMTEVLKKEKFSIMVDESTDKSNLQYMCILVRYFDPENNKIQDRLWDLVQVYDSDEDCLADADSLSQKILDSFGTKEIPTANMLGFCSDTCNVMFGEHHSVNSLLHEAIPDFEALKCGAHIVHLCARNGIRILSSQFEQITHLIYNYIGGSGKRFHKWIVLQTKKFVKPLKIKRPNPIRWLNYYQCMERIYQRWSLLILYFQAELNAEEGLKADDRKLVSTILDYLTKPLLKLYHLFILSIYKKITVSNLLLQSEKPVISLENVPLKKLYLDFLKMYMKGEYITNTDIDSINPTNDLQFKPINNLSLSAEVIEEISKFAVNEQAKFLKDCQSVLAELCFRLKQRYKMDHVCDLNKFTHPKNA